MKVQRVASKRSTRSGQTIVIALLVLAVLLALGFVFAGIVSRNIVQTGRSSQRTLAGDLADSGIRFAHSQMLNSALGADWRPDRTPPVYDNVTGLSRDPDALYLRPGTGIEYLRPNGSGTGVFDRGGPDGLGPFSRVNFDRGRALIRVLYLPGDFATFGSSRGVLRQPGKARYYLRVEAIGRPGRLVPNDPTVLTSEAIQITNFANFAELNAQLGKARQIDARQTDQRKLLAFVSLGLIEHTRFITNKYNVSREAEIGSLTAAPGRDRDGLGVTTENGAVVEVPTLLGQAIYDDSGNQVIQGTGSVYSNASVVFHGNIQSILNPAIGDSIMVKGSIRPANNASQLTLLRVDTGGGITPITLGGFNLSSNSGTFFTAEGLLRDGYLDVDRNGYPRSVGRKDPPSFLTTDPSTGVNRYLAATRNSGSFVSPFANSGRFGHGRGVYVDVFETGESPDETGREESAGSESLFRDWLNPNNPYSRNWYGPYYIPIAAYLELLPDGFRIIRDSRSNNRYWRLPNGDRSNTSVIRYRLRKFVDSNGELRTYIINSLANPAIIDLDGGAITNETFERNGQQFNGLVYIEGDLRVRGVIPTNQQITVAAMGTIYIEGSITKGIVTEGGGTLNAPSTSTLMLMARDHVAINTTMFFGPAPGEVPQPKNVDPSPNTPNPVELKPTTPNEASLTLRSEFLLNPVDNAGVPIGNPTLWEPFATTYQDPDNNAITPTMVITHSADDRGPSAMRLAMTAKTFADPAAQPARDYQFNANNVFNAGVFGLYGLPTFPLYALTTPVAAYPRFESISIPIADNTFTVANRKLTATAALGGYSMGLQDSTDLRITASPYGPYASKNYALARVGMNPHDVRIEAGIFAENGSFFVIPGPGFNVNSEDTREEFEARVAATSLAAAQQSRFADYGSMPGTPFYGEPLNCRVTIVGTVTENMPVPIGQQAEWQKKWGWMPRQIPGTGLLAPRQHIPATWGTINGANPQRYYLPNLIISYDPVLALGSADTRTPVRTTPDTLWVLPPMPRLPVSPTLAYFGEENP